MSGRAMLRAERNAHTLSRSGSWVAPRTFATQGTPLVLRRCTDGACSPLRCQEQENQEHWEKGTPLRLSAESQDAAPAVPSIVHEVLGRDGQPLDVSVRTRMEAGSGFDFSRVRVHADARAAESARAVDARAYTVGRDIVFGAGQYAPTSPAGRSLLAHELAHVVHQQQPGGEPDHMLQRWSYGMGVTPHALYVEVPAPERTRIEKAMLIVSRVANNPRDFPDCPKFFKDNCPGGTAATLLDVFNRVKLWKDTDPDPDVLGSSIGADHAAYTAEGFRIGRWAVAASMFHEFIHNCGQASHVIGDDAKAACGQLPDI